jgi:hypothetical protein
MFGKKTILIATINTGEIAEPKAKLDLYVNWLGLSDLRK